MATQYIRYPNIGSDGSSVLDGSTSGTLTLTVPAVVTSYTLTFPNAQGGANTVLQNDGAGNLSWVSSGGISIGAFDGQSAAANGLTIAASVLYAQSADATHPGMVNTGTQSFAGAKTFSGAGLFSSTLDVTGNFNVATNKFSVIAASGNTSVAGTLAVTSDFAVATNKFTVAAASGNTLVAGTLGVTGALSASNFSGTSSGTNTGDVSLAAVGSSPSANGASLAAQVLTLQPADGSNPGLMTAGTQTIGGAKTFNAAISASNLSGTNTGDVTLAAIGSTANANGASIASQVLTLQPASASFGGIVNTTTQSFAGNKTFTGSVTTQIGFKQTAATNAGVGLVDVAGIAQVTISGAPYSFTVVAANATAGATYTNNGVTYTVVTTISSGTTLVAQGTGTPLASGTLTKTSGTGDATIVFSSNVATTTAGSTASFLLTAGGDGLIIISNSSKGWVALVLMTAGGATLTIVSDPQSKFSIAAGTASKDNLTVSNGTLTIEHNANNDLNGFRCFFLRSD